MGAVVAISAISAIAGVVQAMGALRQGASAKNAAEYNAAAARNRAAAASIQANADADAQDRINRRRLGAIRASAGASGVGLEGSPMDVLSMSASEAEMDKQNILYKGRVKAMGYESEAAYEDYTGQEALAQGRIGAASALLVGGAQAASTYRKG
jgi:hypothetical protein